MLSSKRRFRPMGISDILDETIELYKSSFILLIGIAAIVYVPAFLVSAIIPQPKMAADPGQLPAMLESQIPQAILFLVMVVLIEPLITGALTYAISERYLSKETSIKECFIKALRWRVFRSLIGANIIRYLFVLLPVALIFALSAFAMFAVVSGAQGAPAQVFLALGLLTLGALMFIPMIYFALRFLVVAPAVVVEECGVIGSLQRSWNLMRGGLLKAFGVMLIAIIIVVVITGIITGPTSVVMLLNAQQGKEPSNFILALHTTLYAIVNTLTVPILSIVPILLYYDIRIRKEGFDLQVLADELDHKTREMSARDVSALPQEKLAPEQMGEGPIPDTQA